MALKKLVTFLYNLIILGHQPRIKRAVTSYNASDVVLEKVNIGSAASGSLGRSCLATEDFEGETCCVCLSRLKEEEDMRVLPCLHRFHRACVDRWFNACTKTCPLCRFSMGEEVVFHRREVLTDEMVIWFSSFHVAGF
ncbi:E3 ubiquitin-protein ligase [Melia azedarach]|uniref:E3 ubiquitin-protein ligase n=1 Tax=Melia azedarach TaxID=155640 RepID=A0ACC1XRK7_MELAZ|nr:E3 ubiquitin-protein ligase [Melia azedarach]